MDLKTPVLETVHFSYAADIPMNPQILAFDLLTLALAQKEGGKMAGSLDGYRRQQNQYTYR